MAYSHFPQFTLFAYYLQEITNLTRSLFSNCGDSYFYSITVSQFQYLLFRFRLWWFTLAGEIVKMFNGGLA